MTDTTFYDITPFSYGYSCKESIIQNMHPLLKHLIRQNKNKCMVDVGCGCGRNLLYASSFASQLIGIDLSIQSLNFAKDFIKNKNLELIVGNNLAIPLLDNTVDLVISDGVCHHTGDTVKAFCECIRILKPGGTLYLAVYKKYRYYPLLYYVVGGFLRLINKIKLGNFIIEKLFVKIHYLMYRLFKVQKFSINESRNIFFDYFLTPIATFQSKKDVASWSINNNSTIVDYDRTKGNCHVFIIQKNE